MIPFRVRLEPGTPVHEQVAFAARKALISGQLRPGDRFPSVRALSKACKINPNTAHKVVSQLTAEGMLEIQPGIGAVVTLPKDGAPADRARLLENQTEQLVVEARRLGLTLADVQHAITTHWQNLQPEYEP